MPTFAVNFTHLSAARTANGFLSVLLISSAFAVFSCDRPKTEEPARTEPWQKESDQIPTTQAAKKHEFQVAPGQLLQFELPGRSARPEGAIGGISGSILVDLNALQFVSGELYFDLDELRVVPESTRPSAKKKKDTGTAQLHFGYDGTQLARQWLGLGAQVPQREENRRASFVIESARHLSHPHAYAGALRKREDGAPGEARQVYLSAVGQLKMRGLSVERLISLSAVFYFPESTEREGPGRKNSVPDKITVSLRGETHVPLAEYEISPRDAAGHVITEQLDLLGPVIGSVAKMSGTIEFLPQVAPGAR